MAFVIVLSLLPGVFGINAKSNLTDSTSVIRKAACSKLYSISCFKLDIIGLIERMGAARYQLFPGIFLSYNPDTSEVPQMMLRSLERGSMNKEFDNYISDRLNQYLNSLTLNIKVLDPSTMHHARKLSNEIFSHLVPHETGRRKGHNNHAMWMAGTVAAVSVSALAAISGKALMTSLLALMLTGAKMMHKGSGGGGYGCKSAALIDARTMEIDRIAAAAAAETEFNQHIPIHVFTPSAHGQLTSYGGPPKH